MLGIHNDEMNNVQFFTSDSNTVSDNTDSPQFCDRNACCSDY
jgi:hypothetical protein